MRSPWNSARAVAFTAFLLSGLGGFGARAAASPDVSDPRLAAAIKPPTRSATETPEAYLIRVAEAADSLKLPPQAKSAAIEAYHQRCIQQKQNPCANAPLSKPQVAALESAAFQAEQRAAAARARRLADFTAGGLRANSTVIGGGQASTGHPRPPAASGMGPLGYAPSSQLPRGFVNRSAAPPSLKAPVRPAKASAEPQGSWGLLREAVSVIGAVYTSYGDPRTLAAARQESARLKAQADRYNPVATPTAKGYAMNLLLRAANTGVQVEAFFHDPRAELKTAKSLALSAWHDLTTSPAAELAPKLARAQAAVKRNPTKENRQALGALQGEEVRRSLEHAGDMAMPGGAIMGPMARSMGAGIADDFKTLWHAGVELYDHPEKRNGWYIADTTAKTVMPALDIAGAATGVGGIVKEGGVVFAGRIATEAAAEGAGEAANAARIAADEAAAAEQASGRSTSHGDFKILSDINESHTARVRETEAQLAKLQKEAQAAHPGAALDKNPDYQAALARYKAQRNELDFVRRDMGQAQMDALLQDLAKDGKVRVEADVDPKRFNHDFLNGREGTPPFSEDATIKKVRVEKDIELCQGQAFSSGRASFGKWFIPCASDVYVNDRALRDLIALPDSNGVDSIARVRIPAGTELHIGAAGPIRSETAGRIESMYVNRSGEAVGGGGHGGYTQIYLDPKAQGKEAIADVGLTMVRVVPIPRSNSKVLLELSKRWREAYGDPERARAVYNDFLVKSSMPSAHSSAELNSDFERFHRFFCESFLTENPGAAHLPACRP